MPGVKPFAPDSRRCDEAASVPCASRGRRAGPNSHIHVLKHAGLSHAAHCDARLALRRKSTSESMAKLSTRWIWNTAATERLDSKTPEFE